MTNTGVWLTGISLLRPSPEWMDRTLLAYAGPQVDSGLPPSITVSRDERNSPADPAGEDFEAYVKRQSQVLMTTLPGFQRRPETPLGSGTSEARDILFTWRSNAISLTQWVVWIALADGTMLTFTATSESSKFEQHRATFETALRSLVIDPAAFPSRA